MLNLDTHILIAFLVGELTAREELLLTHENLAVSDIVLWELAKLVSRKRIEMDLDSVAFRRVLRHLTVIPISMQIARRSTSLDFKADPADEIIAATSIVERIPLMTRDRTILKSRLVPFPKVNPRP